MEEKMNEWLGNTMNVYRGFLEDSNSRSEKIEFFSAESFQRFIELDQKDDKRFAFRVLCGSGAKEDKIADLSKAIEINPHNAEWYALRASELMEFQRYEEAITDFTKAIELNPNEVEWYLGRGDSYLNKNDLESAASDYTNAINCAPQKAVCYAKRAGVFLAVKQYDSCSDDCNMAIKLQPNEPDAYLIRGILTKETNGDIELSEDDLLRATELSKSWTLFYDLIFHLYNRSEYQKIIKAQNVVDNYARFEWTKFSNEGSLSIDPNRYKYLKTDNSIPIWKQMDWREEEARVYAAIGSAFYEIESYNRALEFLEIARERYNYVDYEGGFYDPSDAWREISKKKENEAKIGEVCHIDDIRGSITSLQLGNFKAFNQTQNIPIKPITLVFGPNSSGKSSIIHGLIFGQESIETGKMDVFGTKLGGSSIDLGGFRQYIHRRQSSRKMEWGLTFSIDKLTKKLRQLLAPASQITISIEIGLPSRGEKNDPFNIEPKILSYKLETDVGSLIYIHRRMNTDVMEIDPLDFTNPMFKQILVALIQDFTTTDTSTISDADFRDIETKTNQILNNVCIDSGDILSYDNKFKWLDYNDGGKQQADHSPSNKDKHTKDWIIAVSSFLPRKIEEIFRDMNNTLRLSMNRIQYLGPLRSYPERHISSDEHQDFNWRAGGGYAWDIIRRKEEVRKKVNDWLGNKEKLSTPYELSIRYLLEIDDLTSDYRGFIERLEDAYTRDDWTEFGEDVSASGDLFGELYDGLSKLKKNEATVSTTQKLVLTDRRTETQVSHRDVGLGVSQVLPVLVSAYASKNKIIAIEQPEIHLHPALQADLGDVFIESALSSNGNTFILETHSEHLILRILRRIRETSEGELESGAIPLTPDQVAVLYVQPGKNGSEIMHIPINEEGEFDRPWPQGFFAERARELF